MKKGHVFLGVTVSTSLLSLWMMWPYLDAVLWAGFTAYFLHYFTDRLNEYVDNRALTTTFMILVLIGFMAGLSYILLTSIPTIADFISRFSEILAATLTILVDVFDISPALEASLRQLITQVTAGGRSWLLSQIGEVPGLAVNLAIYFVVAIFLVKDWKLLKHSLFDAIRKLPEDYRDTTIAILESIDQLFRGVFISYFIVALTTGVLATVGFYLMGIDFYLGWGIIIGIFAFFPIVSAPMVYLPLSLLYLGPLNEFWLGVLILVYGIVVLNTLPEVLLRPYLAAHQTREHPLLLFLGFIIGSLVLGFKGIILGPILLVLAKNMLTMKYFNAG